jgi:glycosyltransferase involved in cell wall biosynthesis
MKKPVWAVIAARNEEKNIAKVVKETKKYVDGVVVVDDGSTDSTGKMGENSGAIVLKHVVNLGKGAAVNTGCIYAVSNKAGIIVLLDADGQHEPKEIPRFLNRLKECDIVFGIRAERENMPFVFKFGNWFINKTTHILYGVDIKDTQCGYRAFKASIYNKIKWKSAGYSMESEMITNVGKKRLKYSQISISTIYSDKYKGTTVLDGIKIVIDMLWWRLTRW